MKSARTRQPTDVSIAELALAENAIDELPDSGQIIVLVEGDSDAAALITLATRVHATHLHVVAAHGITNYRRILDRIRMHHPHRRVAGLYDEPEEHVIRMALRAAGIGSATTRHDLEQLGFYACSVDLEDELIRSIGLDGVERLLERQRDLQSFRILQRQPAHRTRPVDQQLRRFMGTKSTRKIRYARLLAAAIDLEKIPRPLEELLKRDR